MSKCASFSANLEDLPAMLLWIRKRLIDLKIDLKTVQKIEIASEEAIVNIIQHGYLNQEGKIEIRFNKNSKGLEISIIDQGIPFNPLVSAPLPDLTSSLEKRKEGGVGVFLMKKCVDEIRYQREGNSNILTLSVFFK